MNQKVFLICAICLLSGVQATLAIEKVDQSVNEAGFVGYVHHQTLAYEAFDQWPGVKVKRLSEDSQTGRFAVYAKFPAGLKIIQPQISEQSVDLVMLAGELEFGQSTLGKYDFAFLPPGTEPPHLVSSEGAEALVFFDPPVDDPLLVARQRERGSYVTKFDPENWQTAMLAKSAGATADLKIMHLKQDPDTTARSWYVKLDGSMTVPWEVHSMAEEGFLMEGGYMLAECLPERTVIGEYHQGGYFWRPGGIPHSGPDSGPRESVIWLQRSPVALDVVFYHNCEKGVADQPLSLSSR
jgi:hypothetical protein